MTTAEVSPPRDAYTTAPHDVAHPTPQDALWGLSKREHFAALALQGILANPEFFSSAFTSTDREDAARWAVQTADQLIKELNRVPAP